MRQNRFFFALAVAGLLILLEAAPAQEQSAAPQGAAVPNRAFQPDARKAKKAYEKGQRAEQAEDWAAAFEAYAQAASYAPGDAESVLRREAMRFRLVQQHTDRAEREALAGRLEHAREELRAALQLDPGYSVARERLAQFEAAVPQRVEQAQPRLAGPVTLQPLPGTRDFHYRGDVRGAYEAVAREFGIVATFDSELRPRALRFRIAGVDFETAMTLLGEQTNTFWRPVDARTFFVAADTPQKRHEYAPVVMRTVVLPGSVTPDKMTETLRLVREIAGATHTELDARSRTLTLRDSPETVALAMTLIQEIEQTSAEVILEIEILELDQTAARRLGITPPAAARTFTFSPQDIQQARQSVQGLVQVLSRLFGQPASLTGLTPAQLSALVGSGQVGLGTLAPPLLVFGGGRTLFAATLPGAAADFSETLNVVRRGRRVMLRAREGEPATFFVGERFPITLALLGAGLVSSQFTPAVNSTSFPRTDFPTGTGPAAVAAEDFDGDKKLDLAVANKASDTVSILLGRGDGSFGAKTDFPAGKSPVGVVTGDFNLDAKVDLAVVNQADNTVSILLGKGDGTFNPKTDFPTGNSPVAIVAADFDGDKKLDLAIANKDSSTVSILLGKGDGTFKPKKDFPTGTNPVAIAAGDFNGDGRLDLAIVNQGSNTVSILLGNGDGSFGAKADFPTGKSPVGVAVADFDGDGKLDLAVVNQADNSVSILLGAGNGSFGAKTDFAAGNSPIAIATGDFNVDGRLDLAVVNQASNTVSVLLGLGGGQFAPKFDFSTGASPSAVVAADFNGDGRSDLAITDQADNKVTVILNTAVFVPPGGAIPQTAFPGSEYVDLGLKVRTTPRVHLDNEVTLQLQFEIRSLTGFSFNGIPVISNRTVEQTVRLRQNETTLLSGIIQREETRAVTGLPGLGRASSVGHLAGRRDTQQRETELLILVTPRQLRLAPRTDRSIYAGRGAGAPTTRAVRPQQPARPGAVPPPRRRPTP